MNERIAEWIAANDEHIDPSVRLIVTASSSEMTADLANHPRLDLVGRLNLSDLRDMWARSCAIYFPTSVESFGYPLAEARVNGQPVIALDTSQNKEIAGPALCGFSAGDQESLRCATERALREEVAPDPTPFDPVPYFDWLLGAAK
jgi:glycosyltransferase involved in cell wall biosynthesis